MLWSFMLTAGFLAVISVATVGASGVRDWVVLLRTPYSDYKPQWMGNLRALNLHFGAGISLGAGLIVVCCVAYLLYRGSFEEKFSASLIGAQILSPHTYLYDYFILAIVAALVAMPLLRALVLLPWPFFYPTLDALPWIALSLFCLCAMTLQPLLGRRLGRLESQRKAEQWSC
jgi:hypothetical protein